MSKNLSERYERALERERVAVSFRGDRAKRVMEQVFKQGKGNSISDRIISVLKAGLEAERRDQKGGKRNYRDYIDEGDSMTKESIIEFLEKHFEIDKNLEEKSLPFLEGYLSIRLQSKDIDIDITEVGDLDLGYLEGLIAGTQLKEDVFRKTKTKREDSDMETKIEKLRKARKDVYKGNKKLKDKVEELKEDEDLSEIEALKRARVEYFQEGK